MMGRKLGRRYWKQEGSKYMDLQDLLDEEEHLFDYPSSVRANKTLRNKLKKVVEDE